MFFLVYVLLYEFFVLLSVLNTYFNVTCICLCFAVIFCVFRLYTMVVTRNSQRSPETSEFTSINKLIAKRKEEKRKKKKAKFVEKATTSNVADKVDEGKSTAHGDHDGNYASKGIKT